MVKLFGHLNRLSPNTLKLRVALAEAGVEYEYVPVDLGKREQHRPEFLALNPHGKVPVLVDDDFVLPESDAILWYIAERFPEAGLLGGTARDRARALEWCDFASTALYPAYYDVYFHTQGGAPERRIAAVAEGGQQRFDRALAVLDGTLAERAFVTGDFSIADIALAAVLRAARERVRYDPMAHGALEAWYARVTERPAWRSTIG
jgi:glutathione S-transferase